ncbi:hypothetical protein [Amycolatopsis thermoflava]|uniref:hypothetical protein n=1 Tax=Amycolatopsis thermoflava TaxID=84480 RepID=UPI003EB913E4
MVVDTATRIDVGERRVTPASGGMAGYDYLIYAFGSGSARPGVPGGADFAYSAATSEEVQRLRPVLEAAPWTAPVRRWPVPGCSASRSQSSKRRRAAP